MTEMMQNETKIFQWNNCNDFLEKMGQEKSVGKPTDFFPRGKHTNSGQRTTYIYRATHSNPYSSAGYVYGPGRGRLEQHEGEKEIIIGTTFSALLFFFSLSSFSAHPGFRYYTFSFL